MISATNLQLISDSLSSLGLPVSGDVLSKFSVFFDMVVESNKKFNLTSIVDEVGFVEKHLIDSAVGAKFLTCGKLLDIGAGGGFPSIPIALLCPDIAVHALDSTAKKMTFVAESADSLGLDNLKTIIGRVEDQTALFHSFDFVSARAVASLSILLELALPMLKIGGRFIAYKADDSELELAKNAMTKLNASLVEKFSFTLPSGDKRCLLVFEKTGKTDKIYPRQYSQIKKNPL